LIGEQQSEPPPLIRLGIKAASQICDLVLRISKPSLCRIEPST
jgi:hypothetical protein